MSNPDPTLSNLVAGNRGWPVANFGTLKTDTIALDPSGGFVRVEVAADLEKKVNELKLALAKAKSLLLLEGYKSNSNFIRQITPLIKQ